MKIPAVERVPIDAAEGGVLRVAGTRVSLDTIVGAFRNGATAEEIAQQYPSLSLADVYQVIAYYLRNRDEVHVYLERRSREADQLRIEIEERWPPEGIRERLLARQTTGKRKI